MQIYIFQFIENWINAKTQQQTTMQHKYKYVVQLGDTVNPVSADGLALRPQASYYVTRQFRTS